MLQPKKAKSQLKDQNRALVSEYMLSELLGIVVSAMGVGSGIVVTLLIAVSICRRACSSLLLARLSQVMRRGRQKHVPAALTKPKLQSKSYRRA
jgi:hypothetical protein